MSVSSAQVTKYLYDGLNAIIERNIWDTTQATYTRGLSYGGGIGSIISATRQAPTDHHGPDWPGTTYYHYDSIGGVTGLTDSTGKLIQSYTSDAYGNVLHVDSYLKGKKTIVNPYRFSTKEYNSKSGLIYFGARYYDPKIGRFITPDPWTWGPDDPRLFTPPTSKLVTSLQKDNVIAKGGTIDPNIFISSNFLTQDLKRAILEIGSTYPQNYHRYIYAQNNPVNFVDPYGTFITGTSWKSFLAWLIPTAVGALWIFGYVTWPVFVVACVVAAGLYIWDAFDIVEWARPIIDPAERWKEKQWDELLYGKPPG